MSSPKLIVSAAICDSKPAMSKSFHRCNKMERTIWGGDIISRISRNLHLYPRILNDCTMNMYFCADEFNSNQCLIQKNIQNLSQNNLGGKYHKNNHMKVFFIYEYP